MLYAKINPVASFAQSTNPFELPITTTANYLTANANPYQAGANSTNFQVVYGNIAPSGQAEALDVFTMTSTTSLQLSSAELATWTDDTVLLSIIATKLGTTATEFVSL
jgi:hypothetical protein